MLLERNLLYTGVTRGRKLVVIVGQRKALAIAVRTVRSVRRLTHLACRLSDRKERAVIPLQSLPIAVALLNTHRLEGLRKDELSMPLP